MTWTTGTRPIGGRRKNPSAKVGDRFGTRTVVRLLHRDRTSNERVAWRCRCGQEGTGYVFNLRKAKHCSKCCGVHEKSNPTEGT